jgi:hypothetical protein
MIINWCDPTLQIHTIGSPIIFNQNGQAVGHKIIVSKVEVKKNE